MPDCKNGRGNRGREMKTSGYGWRDRNQPVITSCVVLSEEAVQDGRDGSVLKQGVVHGDSK